MNPLLEEPEWSCIVHESSTAYTRPLLGSELIVDQYSQFFQGMTECCMGLTFSTSTPLSLDELLPKSREAMMRLRLVSPAIAAFLQSGIHDPELRSWVYKPLTSMADATRWAAQTVVTASPMDPEDFIVLMGQKRLPYFLEDGSKQILRSYLFEVAPQANQFAIFFHGSHTLMDARPTIHALKSMLEAMFLPQEIALEDLSWGTEWRRLPPGPITATGGARDGWEVEGVALLNKFGKLYQDPVPTCSLVPQRVEPQVFGKAARVTSRLDELTSMNIIKAVKSSGFSVTYLFEAAQILSIFSLNPVEEKEANGAHITFPAAIVSLGRFMIPPYDDQSNFVSAMALLPIRIDYRDVQFTQDPKSRLLGVMRLLKAQYDEHMRNPHFPAVTAVQTKLFPPREPVISANPYASTATNIGDIDRMVQLRCSVENARVAPPPFEVGELFFGHRDTTPVLQTHTWTMHSRINLQIQTTDIWDKEYLWKFLDEIIRQALVIVS